MRKEFDVTSRSFFYHYLSYLLVSDSYTFTLPLEIDNCIPLLQELWIGFADAIGVVNRIASHNKSHRHAVVVLGAVLAVCSWCKRYNKNAHTQAKGEIL